MTTNPLIHTVVSYFCLWGLGAFFWGPKLKKAIPW